jgi:hypothetical protein
MRTSRSGEAGIVRGAACWLSIVVALGGCGSRSDAPDAREASVAAQRTTDAKPLSPTLVFLQRNGGLAATLDTVEVREDGTVRLERRYGGAGGRFDDFQLRAADLTRLERLVARAPLASPGPAEGRATRAGYTYIVRAQGHTATGLQGALPIRLRQLVRMLDAILDGEVPREASSETAAGQM